MFRDGMSEGLKESKKLNGEKKEEFRGKLLKVSRVLKKMKSVENLLVFESKLGHVHQFEVIVLERLVNGRGRGGSFWL